MQALVSLSETARPCGQRDIWARADALIIQLRVFFDRSVSVLLFTFFFYDTAEKYVEPSHSLLVLFVF